MACHGKATWCRCWDIIQATLWLSVCLCVCMGGALLFVRSFFLTRVELPHVSTCESNPLAELSLVPHGQDPSGALHHHGIGHNGGVHAPEARRADPAGLCWLGDHRRPRHSRLVLLVVDGLRHDFVMANRTCACTPSACIGGLPGAARVPFRSVSTLLRSRPQHSALLCAEADAPTVTQQRLKAIVTGSLPTFLDIRHNFASPVVTEDNLVAQLARHNFRCAAALPASEARKDAHRSHP